jgi:tetratricopeptide (TPR) repeat protein
MEDWPGAGVEFLKCLTLEAECAYDRSLTISAWSGLLRVACARHHPVGVGRAYKVFLAATRYQKNDRDRVGLALVGLSLSGAHLLAGEFEKAMLETRDALRVLPSGRRRLLLRAYLEFHHAVAQFGFDLTDAGRKTAAHAAECLRSSRIPEARRNPASLHLAELGKDLWDAGEFATGIALMREGIERLEAAGAVTAAAQYRIRLASFLAHHRQMEEAWQCLPQEAGMPDWLLRNWLMVRAGLYLAESRPQEAIADCQRLLPLWKAEPIESALVECLLSEAYLEAGDPAQASTLARKAADVLGPWQHCETAGCLITLALAQWGAEREWQHEYANEARRLIQSDTLLRAPRKARLFEVQAARLERHGRLEEACSFRGAGEPRRAAAMA